MVKKVCFTKLFSSSKHTYSSSQLSATFLSQFPRHIILQLLPNYPIISIISKTKGLMENLFPTELLSSSKHSFLALSQPATTFLAKVGNLANYHPIMQLSQKLKVWRKKFDPQSFSAHRNTSFRRYPSSLWPSYQKLEICSIIDQLSPNYLNYLKN